MYIILNLPELVSLIKHDQKNATLMIGSTVMVNSTALLILLKWFVQLQWFFSIAMINSTAMVCSTAMGFLCHFWLKQLIKNS